MYILVLQGKPQGVSFRQFGLYSSKTDFPTVNEGLHASEESA